MKTIFSSVLLLVSVIACGKENRFMTEPVVPVAEEPIPIVDVATLPDHTYLIKKGTETIKQGLPTAALLPDGTILCVYPSDGKTRMSQSTDGGKTWEDVETPSDWSKLLHCPSIYYTVDPEGKERLVVYSASGNTNMTYSEDNGETWTAVKSLGIPTVMSFTTLHRLPDCSYLGMSNRRPEGLSMPHNEVYAAISTDGGLTWGNTWTCIHETENNIPCEPCIIPSPDGKKLAVVCRDNKRDGYSLVAFSEDNGKTWTEPIETPWGVTGDRHTYKYASDGRLVIVFEDMAKGRTHENLVAWVGNFEDLETGNDGQYKIKLLDNFGKGDSNYPALILLPDGTFVAVTSVTYEPGNIKNSIVCSRFSLSETDALFLQNIQQ